MAQLSTKDKKTVADHPDATPHELLTKFGLSEAGFNKISADKARQKNINAKANHAIQEKAGKAKKLTPLMGHILQPNTSLPTPTSQNVNDKVRLVPISGGMGTVMSRKIAERKVRMSPKKFKIV